MRRGGLQLSLNALVMFILSVIVLGFGVFLVNVFLGTGFEIINPPDHCMRDITNDLTDGRSPTVCPERIPEGSWNPGAAYEIRFGVINSRPSTLNLTATLDSTSDFELLGGELYDVESKDARIGIFSIRLKESASPPTGPVPIPIRVCSVDFANIDDPNDDVVDCAGDLNLGSRILTVNAPD